MNIERTSGYYWIKFNNPQANKVFTQWQPAEYSEDYDKWYFVGTDDWCNTEELEEHYIIGEKIEKL